MDHFFSSRMKPVWRVVPVGTRRYAPPDHHDRSDGDLLPSDRPRSRCPPRWRRAPHRVASAARWYAMARHLAAACARAIAASAPSASGAVGKVLFTMGALGRRQRPLAIGRQHRVVRAVRSARISVPFQYRLRTVSNGGRCLSIGCDRLSPSSLERSTADLLHD